MYVKIFIHVCIYIHKYLCVSFQHPSLSLGVCDARHAFNADERPALLSKEAYKYEKRLVRQKRPIHMQRVSFARIRCRRASGTSVKRSLLIWKETRVSKEAYTYAKVSFARGRYQRASSAVACRANIFVNICVWICIYRIYFLLLWWFCTSLFWVYICLFSVKIGACDARHAVYTNTHSPLYKYTFTNTHSPL